VIRFISLREVLAIAWPIIFAFASAAGAADVTQIGNILENPAAHHLRHANLQGTVRQVQPLDPYETPSGARCYGGYVFRLEDDTGSIPVAVTGICGVPLVRDPDVEDGDRVLVEATVQAPTHGGYSLSFKGLKITTEQEGTVQAVAARITPLPE
jgi:hypothetical protein